jgi:hypothetical protein
MLAKRLPMFNPRRPADEVRAMAQAVAPAIEGRAVMKGGFHRKTERDSVDGTNADANADAYTNAGGTPGEDGTPGSVDCHDDPRAESDWSGGRGPAKPVTAAPPMLNRIKEVLEKMGLSGRVRYMVHSEVWRIFVFDLPSINLVQIETLMGHLREYISNVVIHVQGPHIRNARPEGPDRAPGCLELCCTTPTMLRRTLEQQRLAGVLGSLERVDYELSTATLPFLPLSREQQSRLTVSFAPSIKPKLDTVERLGLAPEDALVALDLMTLLHTLLGHSTPDPVDLWITKPSRHGDPYEMGCRGFTALSIREWRMIVDSLKTRVEQISVDWEEGYWSVWWLPASQPQRFMWRPARLHAIDASELTRYDNWYVPEESLMADGGLTESYVPASNGARVLLPPSATRKRDAYGKTPAEESRAKKSRYAQYAL